MKCQWLILGCSINFLGYVPLDAQIILVGDEDQLPSVGPSQVFKDLIESKAFQS